MPGSPPPGNIGNKVTFKKRMRPARFAKLPCYRCYRGWESTAYAGPDRGRLKMRDSREESVNRVYSVP